MAQHVGLSLIFEPETTSVAPIDIIFIHGVGGHPFDTWTADKSGTFWPRDILPKDIPYCRILTYGYDKSSSGSVSAIADAFLEELVESRHQSPEASLVPNHSYSNLRRTVERYCSLRTA